MNRESVENNGANREEQDDDEDTHRVAESAQLKGTIWPGMGIFDSATPDMQKRRNQKKDGSILEQMLFTSANTQATEVVYNGDFTFRKNRDIFGDEFDSDEQVRIYFIFGFIKLQLPHWDVKIHFRQ